jgi:LCP family protein required for cell wall assembly
MTKRRLSPAWFILVGIVVVFTAVFLVLVLPRPHRGASTLEPSPTGTLNILIVGKDARAVGPVSNDGRQRNVREEQSHSDIIIICHINFSRPRLNLVAIPRDLLVEVPGVTHAASNTDFTNMEKITHTYAIGGEKLLRRTIETTLGITIQRYIAFDFDSFRMAFDVLRPFVGALRVGKVTLSERDQALKFARKRYGLQFDDADRCRNAVGLIQAVISKTWWLANTRLGDMLVNRLLGIVGPDTDLTADEIDAVVSDVRRSGMSPTRIRTAVLVSSGAEVTLNRYHQTLSCYLPVYTEIRKQVDFFLLDKDEVKALDFMTQEPFRVPGYFEYNYVTMMDSGPVLEFETTGLDSKRVETKSLELQQLKNEKAPADTGRR